MNRLYFEYNDVFSNHSDDSLDRIMLPNDKTNQGASTRNDQASLPKTSQGQDQSIASPPATSRYFVLNSVKPNPKQ